MEKCMVSVTVRGSDWPSPQTSELGEFQRVWSEGVSIGSDPGCTVVLPGLPAVAARVVAGSNHKFLHRLPTGTSLPLPPVGSMAGEYDDRVDYRAFQIGPYSICFGEIYRAE